jgi:geranylgeranyl pyrophosphate synthase
MEKLSIPTHQLLLEVEARMREQLDGYPSALVENLEQLINRGGKRIRPILTLLLGNMFCVEHETLLNLAAAIEMLHTATLVHDDLIDDADQRRGSKTINALFATSATVLAGDLAFATAARLGAAIHSTVVMQRFAETLQTIVSGEITHMFRNGNKVDRAAYYAWIHAKTASLFELACEAAVMIGSVEDAMIRAARTFGHEIGMAFQIMDDVLDFTGDSVVLGKPVGNDLRQGIITLPAIYYFESHDQDPDVRSIIQNNGHSQAALEGIITAIRQDTAVDLARAEAQSFLQRGLEALASLPNTPECLELERLAVQVIDRKK